MDYTTVVAPPIVLKPTVESELIAGHSLYQALQRLPNPRRAQGKRYELALLLCLLVLAKLVGQTSGFVIAVKRLPSTSDSNASRCPVR